MERKYRSDIAEKIETEWDGKGIRVRETRGIWVHLG